MDTALDRPSREPRKGRVRPRPGDDSEGQSGDNLPVGNQAKARALPALQPHGAAAPHDAVRGCKGDGKRTGPGVQTGAKVDTPAAGPARGGMSA
jgi:hypothetical protein